MIIILICIINDEYAVLDELVNPYWQRGKKVVTVVCGRNVDLEVFKKIIQ